MKYLVSLLVLLLLCITATAQAPEKLSYQAVIRNSENLLIVNQEVGIQISVIQDSPNGTIVFQETYEASTNQNGLVSMEIGTGLIDFGSFEDIDWTAGPYYIETATDPNGGTDYSIVGVSELLSVPYALYAKTSGSSIPGPEGPSGEAGEDGMDGQSAYDIWLVLGNSGTESDFIASLTGPQGEPGIQGPQGPQGEQGPQGPAGAAGNGIASTTENGDGTYTFTYDDGSTFTTSDLTGPQGPQGPTGQDGQDGTGVEIIGSVANSGALPGNYTGDIGDMFIASDTGSGWVWDGASWVNVGQIQGPQGPQGPIGMTGPQGPIGLTGPQGPQGPIGLTGPQGPQGEQGPQGIDGQGGITTAGNNVSITGSGTEGDPYVVNAVDNVDDADNDPSNELQVLSLSNDTLYLSNGNSVYLGSLTSIGSANSAFVAYESSGLFTVPNGVNQLIIEAWGAGGGGCSSCTCTWPSSRYGGGGGAYGKVIASVTPGEVIPITVGVGGPGGIADGVSFQSGSAGTSTVVGVYLSAGGGGGGSSGSGGAGGTCSAVFSDNGNNGGGAPGGQVGGSGGSRGGVGGTSFGNGGNGGNSLGVDNDGSPGLDGYVLISW